ncbi:MAG: hypothetical protein HKO72_11975 [Flavobacteriaceae bacterium]|nr:acyloxyacyl hydrolase [Bacteroidia bacterium]NNL62042.1 hypothetical protein [Flavobacteriaceae bacterium]
MKTIYKGLFSFFLFSISSILVAQEKNSFFDSRHRVGFLVGYGTQNFGQLSLEVPYDYEITFFKAQYYYVLKKGQEISLELLAQPQFNLTQYRHIDFFSDKSNGFEVGLNIGALIRKNLNSSQMSIYAAITSGPHFVSGTPQRQVEGFVFSSNFMVGVNFRLNNHTFLDIRPSFRHISNLDFKKPNGGVNNLVLSGGVLVNL